LGDRALAQTTGTDLVNFLEYAEKKGLINRNTASSVKVACRRVLGLEGDLKTLDIATLDINSLFRRFENLHRTEFTPRSLETYRSRVNMGIKWFLGWSRDPAAWKPVGRPVRGVNGETKRRAGPRGDSSSPDDSSHFPGHLRAAGDQRVRLVDYPFPLRDDVIVRLQLPPDLRGGEVKRLTAYMSTLTVDSSEGEN
jgi:hypothetical protein